MSPTEPRSEDNERPFPDTEETSESLAEVLGDVLDLAEQTASRITDDQLEERLRWVLGKAEPGAGASGSIVPDPGTPPVPSDDAEPSDWEVLPVPVRRVIGRSVLSEHQIRLLAFLAEGKRIQEVAAQVHATVAQVRDDLVDICRGLGVSVPIQAVVWAAQHDLLPPVARVPLRTADNSGDEGTVDDPGPPPGVSLLARGFWNSLEQPERDALFDYASKERFPQGEVLWREGDVADHLLVIVSGWVRIFVESEDGERNIAFRGPGDIIGERAALLLRQRSATVVALDVVHALSMSTSRFHEFAAVHPRVLAVLEREIYVRLAERSGISVPLTAPALPEPGAGAGEGFASFDGQVCSILFVDMAEFAAPMRSDRDRANMRASLYELMREAFAASHVPWDGCHREDRGDGLLIVVPPWMPTRPISDLMVGHLNAVLREHNGRVPDSERLRLRLALHVGPVMADSMGVSGSAIIHAARLLELPDFRMRLAGSGAGLGFITSAFVYDSVIARGSPDAERFQEVHGQVKESTLTGWVHLADDAHTPRPRSAPPPASHETPLPAVLSQPEAEIVGMVTLGLTDEEIALSLRVDKDRVRERFHRIRLKYPPPQPDRVPLALTLANLARRLTLGA